MNLRSTNRLSKNMKNFIKNPIELKTVGAWGAIDDIVHYALTIQTILGQQLLDPQWSLRKVRVQLFVGLPLWVYVTLGTLDCLYNNSDIEMVAEALYTMIMIVVIPIKLGLYISNRNLFRNLYAELKTTIFDAIEVQSALKPVLRKSKLLVTILYASVVIPVTGIELVALWGYVTDDRVPLSRTTSTFMPMTSPFYEIGWILHSIFLIQVSTTIILDMWFLLFILFMCAANDALVKILTVDKKIINESEIMYGERLNDALRQFYKGHVKQMQFLRTLNKMYKWLAFVPLCNAGMCICIILLLLSKDINWKFGLHFLPMIAEIFTYNYFGENIKSKASEINQALLSFDWTSLLLGDKKSFYIIATYMQQEFGIKTGLGSDLSLITMTSVLQATYRAFTMLQSV